MYYIYIQNNLPKLEWRSQPPPGKYWIADPEHTQIDAYEWIDGVPFVSERLVADLKNDVARKENELLLKK